MIEKANTKKYARPDILFPKEEKKKKKADMKKCFETKQMHKQVKKK